MSDTRKLVYAVIQFLKTQLENGELSGESAEGVEVGIQCLEAAYDISESEPSLEISCGLQEIFQKYLAENGVLQESTAQNKALAESLKNEGNKHMSSQNFNEAVASYSKAIKLDPTNAVYYCNRAAALNNLRHYEGAIEDCKTALKIDPLYCKAYGRLGLAHANLNHHQEAVTNYRRAVDLEPNNECYKTNLRLAEEALASTSTSSNASGSLPFQNADLGMIFTNPNLLNMASQMLANPSMQDMMNNILSGNMGQGGSGRMDVLLQASQQLAQQIENENPAMVEQLRRQMGNGGAGGSGASGPSNSDSKPPNREQES